MASSQVDKILEVYKQLAQIPNLTSARIVSTTKNRITIQSLWSERNLELCKQQKFAQDFSFDSNLEPLVESFPRDVSSEILSVFNEDDSLSAILREVKTDEKTKQFIEIWDRQHLIKSYDLSAFDVHGDVYSNSNFSSFQWSPDSTRLLYVAEKKSSKSEPFYKQGSKSKKSKDGEDDELSKGTKYIFKPDWGEQLVGKHKSVVVVLNVEEDTITPLDSIPDDYFPSQVTWAPNGNDIVGVAYKLYSRYLGVNICTNRESYIFHLKGSEFRKLTAADLACRSPRFSPDGKHLVWLERELSAAHRHVMRLAHIEWDVSETPTILVDTVKTHVDTSNNKKFYGLYIQDLPKRCWSSDSKYIFISTPQRSNIKSYIVNLESKALTEINYPGRSSLAVLDVKINCITFIKSSLLEPSQLLVAKFNPAAADVGNLYLLPCSKAVRISSLEKLMYDTTEFVHDTQDSVKDFNFTFVGKRSGEKHSMPLIALLHGGPHSTFTNEFNTDHIAFALLGFGVLRVNYRGSIGLGGDSVDYLLGKVGESDVLDCLTAVDAVLEKYSWLNPNKVALKGGSHGGFLAAHLSGQYPDKFQAVVIANPVIDLASDFSTTDIPDWCSGIAGCSDLGTTPETTSTSNYSELMKIMLKHSPIIHADKVKAPTFIALGSSDLRVPAFQGKLWYYRLTKNNVKTKLCMYHDNHSLGKDKVKIDFFINSTLWLVEHVDCKLDDQPKKVKE